jgi:hypothetical protein
MTDAYRPSLATVLVDGFEKNEILGGWHERVCPFSTDADARAAFETWAVELRSWLGPPSLAHDDRYAWGDRARILVSGRGVGVWITCDARFREVWADQRTWEGQPLVGLTWD